MFAQTTYGLGDSQGERISRGSVSYPLGRFLAYFLADTRK